MLANLGFFPPKNRGSRAQGRQCLFCQGFSDAPPSVTPPSSPAGWLSVTQVLCQKLGGVNQTGTVQQAPHWRLLLGHLRLCRELEGTLLCCREGAQAAINSSRLPGDKEWSIF